MDKYLLKLSKVNFERFYESLQKGNFLPLQIKDKEYSNLAIRLNDVFSNYWYEVFNDENRRVQLFERVKQRRDIIIDALDSIEKLLFIEYMKNNENPPYALAVKKMIDEFFEEHMTLLGMIYSLSDSVKHSPSIVATKNRAKRKDEQNPNIEKARELAKEIWADKSKQSLSDTAYEIKNQLNLRQSSTTVQEWIRNLNPNAKKKK